MIYRREIDGLRALAVLPVLMFHAGFHTFRGGFVGVDMFFVISGYLITSIILSQLKLGNFSIVRFYERRARRILPALFVVMIVSSVFAYVWMMPDEFKNFGQSIFATTIFSNNILLAATTGYWDLASEFKPLLHTWSLGVEEQYYIIFPILLALGWRRLGNGFSMLLGTALLISLAMACWGVVHKPDLTFYILPTRAWEIVVGALAAFYKRGIPFPNANANSNSNAINEVWSICGLAAVLFSILAFSQNQPSPGIWMIVPTLGTAMILIFASDGTVVHRLLSARPIVGIGLISYSLYLWHQPILAFARIYSVNPLGRGAIVGLLLLTFLLACVTWKFVEAPFRSQNIISLRVMICFAVTLSATLMVFGLYLNSSYGMPSRIRDATFNVADMDKRYYIERVFKFKKDRFSADERLKLLVVGNSFARDFVNMTTEVFDQSKYEVIYRDDLTECVIPFKGQLEAQLYGSASVVVFAGHYEEVCLNGDIAFSHSAGKDIFYVGTKYFGYNLNWIIRIPLSERSNQYNPLLAETADAETEMSAIVPTYNCISLLSAVTKGGQIPVTDSHGRLLSTDRAHLTRYGAIFFGEKALRRSRYGQIVSRISSQDRLTPGVVAHE